MPMFNYWNWFFAGSGGRPGYRRLLGWWLLVHLAVGALVAFVVRVDLPTAANSVLFPLASIFVGLAFAWAGNAMALMQSSEIEKLTEQHEGGYAEYVYTYQTAILVILVTMVLWGLAGMRVFAVPKDLAAAPYVAYGVKAALFGLSSMALRECWHVVLGSQWMLLAQHAIRKHSREKRQEDKKNGK